MYVSFLLVLQVGVGGTGSGWRKQAVTCVGGPAESYSLDLYQIYRVYL